LLGEETNRTISVLKSKSEATNIEVSYLIDSKVFHFSCTIIKIDESFQSSYQGTIIDITESVLNQEKILYLATHDSLTTLYNRNHFEHYISSLKKDKPIGVMVCDIDGLKLINDAFGHADGDNLLKKFALTLKNICPNAFIARIGGDEFSIIELDTTHDEMELIERKINEAIDDFYVYGISFEVSLGYAIWDNNNSDFTDCFKSAENIMYRRKLTERFSRKSNALSTIMESLHEKTEETKDHCQRVGEYASLLLYEIGYRRNIDIEEIKFLSEVHDIGKIAISDIIINKPGSLTFEEYETMKYHAEAGYKIIRNITEKEDIAYGVLYHHERWDGTGYPHGLKEEQIPLYARIISITDAFDTMVRGRVYKPAMTTEAAFAELIKHAGTQFDPELVKTFVKIMLNKIN
jgi:diguanylate cyclase (GGDEF)-like protein